MKPEKHEKKMWVVFKKKFNVKFRVGVIQSKHIHSREFEVFLCQDGNLKLTGHIYQSFLCRAWKMGLGKSF